MDGETMVSTTRRKRDQDYERRRPIRKEGGTANKGRKTPATREYGGVTGDNKRGRNLQ